MKVLLKFMDGRREGKQATAALPGTPSAHDKLVFEGENFRVYGVVWEALPSVDAATAPLVIFLVTAGGHPERWL